MDYTNEEIEDIKKEMISKVDKDAVAYFFKITLQYSYEAGRAETDKVDDRAIDHYLKLWSEAKWRLYILLGRQLCYKFETGIDIGDEFSSKLSSIFNIENITRNKGRDKTPVVIDATHFRLYEPFLKLFPTNDLLKNICPKSDSYSFLGKVYKPNQKLSRFFSKYLNDENFDIELSKLYQNKVQGIVGNISIDPVDFLTISLSTHYTGSCYSLFSFYQCAGYALMLDETTLVCFNYRGDKEILSYMGHDDKRRKVDIPIYNKINRFFIDLSNGGTEIAFHSHVVYSSKEFESLYLNEVAKIFKKIGEDVEYTKVKYRVEINANHWFAHFQDNPSSEYCKVGTISNSGKIFPGANEVPCLSNIDINVPKNEKNESYMY